jgi:hypothetical protein
MTIRICLQALLLVPLFGMSPGAGDLNRPEMGGLQTSAVTCRFKACFEWEEARNDGSTFQIRGTPHQPQYIVRFDSYSGGACLEQHQQPWPATFQMKISGRRDTILFVSLIPQDYGEMLLHFVPGKKWVNYYDDRGKWLGQSTDKAFQIETVETADGLEVKVTLPKPARSMRRLQVRYWSTFW